MLVLKLFLKKELFVRLLFSYYSILYRYLNCNRAVEGVNDKISFLLRFSLIYFQCRLMGFSSFALLFLIRLLFLAPGLPNAVATDCSGYK